MTEHHNPTLKVPCRTDVYAAIYKCPLCLKLVETLDALHITSVEDIKTEAA